MDERAGQDVFINLGGQDDNLGDSALRAAYFLAAQGDGRSFHILLEGRSSDYVTGLPLREVDTIYTSRAQWNAASAAATRPVHLAEAGEINPRGRSYPVEGILGPQRDAVAAGGIVISAGMGLKDPSTLDPSVFAPTLREAAVVSWRDAGSRDAAGFGDVAPDWAFALGTPTSEWASADARDLIAVTLRFDRAWPDDAWLSAVKGLASRTSTRIVTVAQVARDAPRAVRLAEALDGEYLVAPSTSHADLDAHVRSVFSRSLAVVSDRAHGLIIGATEGAYPLGSAADPQKIIRLLATAGLGDLVGDHTSFESNAEALPGLLPGLAPAVDAARTQVAGLGARMRAAMDAVA